MFGVFFLVFRRVYRDGEVGVYVRRIGRGVFLFGDILFVFVCLVLFSRRISMVSDLAVSCRFRSAIWLAEVFFSFCSEFCRCCTFFSSRRIFRFLEVRVVLSRGFEYSVKFILFWG